MLALSLVLVMSLPPAFAPLPPGHPKHHSHAKTHGANSAADVALARRVARLTRLAILVRREALLRDFLATALTEMPLFVESNGHTLGGVTISNTIVSLDFLGMPIVRARVHNDRSTPQSLEIVARMQDTTGAQARAATVISLDAGATRSVELSCPARLVPASVVWSIVQL